MNTLTKCIEELKKDKPDIRYILGMLETYLELSGSIPSQKISSTGSGTFSDIRFIGSNEKPVAIVEEMTPEEKEYYAKMAGGTIAPMHE